MSLIKKGIGAKLMGIQKKREIDPQSSKLKEIFRRITKKPKFDKNAHINAKLLKKYLCERYAEPIVEAMLNHIRIEFSGDFEDFTNMMNRIIFASDEVHLLVFMDIFDINKDKYICASDVFNIIQLDTTQSCTSDIALVSEQFNIKRS